MSSCLLLTVHSLAYDIFAYLNVPAFYNYQKVSYENKIYISLRILAVLGSFPFSIISCSCYNKDFVMKRVDIIQSLVNSLVPPKKINHSTNENNGLESSFSRQG